MKFAHTERKNFRLGLPLRGPASGRFFDTLNKVERGKTGAGK